MTYAYDELNRMAAVARGAEVHQYVCDRPVDRTIAIAMPSAARRGVDYTTSEHWTYARRRPHGRVAADI